MTPEEKIEALREWLGNHHPPCRCMICVELLNPIRDIIDPPVPKWRRIVDKHETIPATDPNCPPQYALSEILFALHRIADERPESNYLAQIVAICEAQVGDGWQVDPEDAYSLPSADVDQYTVRWLLDSLVRYFEPANYLNTGNRAAYWLRHLTDGGAE